MSPWSPLFCSAQRFQPKANVFIDVHDKIKRRALIHHPSTMMRDKDGPTKSAGTLTWIKAWKDEFASELTRSGPQMAACIGKPTHT